MFECEDVRGRIVSASDEWWTEHILKRRPWMDGWEELVEITLIHPEIIHSDKQHKTRECYYRTGVPLDEALMLKVVVEFDKNNAGTLVTAFPTSRIPRQEVKIWP